VDAHDGKKVLDYDSDQPYYFSRLKQWKVVEELSHVKEALLLYKSKKVPIYNKKIWFVNKGDEQQTVIVEYSTQKKNDRLIFSPDENTVFYLGISSSGDNAVYGLNLLTNEKLEIAQADHFQIETCPNKESFIVVQQEDGQREVVVYTLNGTKTKSFNSMQSLKGIAEFICD